MGRASIGSDGTDDDVGASSEGTELAINGPTGTRYALTKLLYCTEPFDDASSHSGWVPFRNTSKHFC